MPRPHRHTHRDSNQAQIAQALRRIGYVVWDISPLPGLCDIAVCGLDMRSNSEAWKLFEIKTDEGRVSPEQQEMIDAGMVVLARSVLDVLQAFGRMGGG